MTRRRRREGKDQTRPGAVCSPMGVGPGSQISLIHFANVGGVALSAAASVARAALYVCIYICMYVAAGVSNAYIQPFRMFLLLFSSLRVYVRVSACSAVPFGPGWGANPFKGSCGWVKRCDFANYERYGKRDLE